MCEIIDFFDWCSNFTNEELAEKIKKNKARKPFNSKANQEKHRARINKINSKFYKELDNG